MKWKILFLACLVLFIVSLSAVSASSDSNQSVGDEKIGVLDLYEENGLGADDGTFTELQEMFNGAQNGSTINLEKDYVYDVGFQSSGISIDLKQDLTIDGNGHSLDGLSKSRILEITNSHNIQLKNIKFINGCDIDDGRSPYQFNRDEGGAIHINYPICSGLALNIVNCEFINNEAGNYGGAIYARLRVTNSDNLSPAFCIIHNSVFRNNHAKFGGAIYNGFFDDENWRIINCEFDNNSADSSGGAISSEISNLIIDNCKFNNNHAGSNGGAIEIKESSASYGGGPFSMRGGNNTVISGCEFNNNNANRFGGAIYWDAPNGVLNYSMFKNNTGWYYGSAIYWEGDNGKMEYCRYYNKDLSKENNLYVAGSNFELIEYIILIDASNVTKYYGGPERLHISLTESGTPIVNAKLNISINGALYTRTTDSEGKASMPINLPVGEYRVFVSYGDVTIFSNVVVKSTLSADDIIMMYRNRTRYVVSVKEDNNALANIPLVLNINGVLYSRTTTAEGTSSLAINLNPGEYVITAERTDTGEKFSSNILIKSLLVENNDISMFFRNGSGYTVKVIMQDGTVAGAGEVVTFNINGVFYDRKTNDQGIARLNLNLEPGDYIITADYHECKVSNMIHILPVLTASDLTKQFGDLTPFSVKLVNGHGLPAIGKTITFNINGVFYNRTTDLLGVARLNINLLPGEYIITSIFGENGAITSNKVTITSIRG